MHFFLARLQLSDVLRFLLLLFVHVWYRMACVMYFRVYIGLRNFTQPLRTWSLTLFA